METNNNPWIIIAFVAVFVGIFIYVIIAKIRRRGATWTGTIIDKNVSETATAPINDTSNSQGLMIGGNRNAVNRDYSLRIKSDTGKEFNWPVGEGFYEVVQVGDRLTKNTGTEIPTKL